MIQRDDYRNGCTKAPFLTIEGMGPREPQAGISHFQTFLGTEGKEMTIRILCGMTLLSVMLAHTETAVAEHRLWRPYVEIETRGGTYDWVGQARLFLPVRQDHNSLLFADLRGFWMGEDYSQGNFGLAYRELMDNGWIFGANAFVDVLESDVGHHYVSGGAGLEALTVDKGVRINGYFPEETRGQNEASYWGFDAEAEHRVWRYYDGTWDAEVWAILGVYHYDNDALPVRSLTGGRARAELRLFDLPKLGYDSRIVLAGEYEYDDARESVGTGMLTARIPFGSGGGDCGHKLCGTHRRMVAPINRRRPKPQRNDPLIIDDEPEIIPQ